VLDAVANLNLSTIACHPQGLSYARRVQPEYLAKRSFRRQDFGGKEMSGRHCVFNLLGNLFSKTGITKRFKP